MAESASKALSRKKAHGVAHLTRTLRMLNADKERVCLRVAPLGYRLRDLLIIADCLSQQLVATASAVGSKALSVPPQQPRAQELALVLCLTRKYAFDHCLKPAVEANEFHYAVKSQRKLTRLNSLQRLH